jgi:TonB family protein
MLPASDVWSVGMTLVEALTQQPPAWGRTELAEVAVPDTLPEPFFDIASHCLRRDPQRRWTVAEIEGMLRALPTPQGQEIAAAKNGVTKWGYLLLAIGAVLLLAILGPRLFHRHPAAEPAASSTVESSAEQPEAKEEEKSGQAAQISRGKEQASARSNASRAARRATAKNGVTNNSGPDRAQGAVIQQILPDVSRSALRTVHGKLKVRVKAAVDASGKVSVVNFDSRGPSRYFAERALQAARRWTFRPPQINGQGVPSEWSLKFEFERSGVSVQPAQVFP